MIPYRIATSVNERTKVPSGPLGSIMGTDHHPILVSVQSVLIQTTYTNLADPGWSALRHRLKHPDTMQGASLMASDRDTGNCVQGNIL